MAKYLIIGLAFILVFSMVFGLTYTDGINKISNMFSGITDKVIGVLQGLKIIDVSIMDIKNDSHLIDYRYANFGSYDTFELGHIDKDTYIVENFLPKFCHSNMVNGISFSCKLDPYYNSIKVSEYDPDEDDNILLYDTIAIHYKISISISSTLIDGIITPSKQGTFEYDVFVLPNNTPSESHITPVYARYVVADSDTYNGCFVSDQLNNMPDFCTSAEDNKRLNGKHVLHENVTFFDYNSISKSHMISDDSYNSYFISFMSN